MPLPENVERAELAGQAVALIVRSIALQHDGKAEAALACLNQALDLVPDFPPSLVKRGTMLLSLGLPRAALADFDRCLELAAGMAHVVPLRDAAVHALLDELSTDSATAAQHREQAELLTRLGRHDEALAQFRQALDLDAEYHVAWNGMGNLLLRLNRHAEALACYESILTFSPDDAIALFNRGNVLQQEGAYHEALASYARALIARPDLAEIRMEQAHCHLALGNWDMGLNLFETRWSTAQLSDAMLPASAPLWRGERAADATLLLWAEQGLGDTLQFLRHVPWVASMVDRVVLRVPASLCSLLQCMATERLTILSQGQPLPPHDLHCPLMSLPLATKAAPHSMEQTAAYLSVPVEQQNAMQDLLGQKTKARIGLVWAGGQRHLNNPTRDMPLPALLPLLAFDAEWFSLQKPHAENDRQILAHHSQVRCMDAYLDDFAATAALLAGMDLLISVDTAVAHLAGALGVPTWLLLRKSGEWRWQCRSSTSPWYLRHRLFRQARHGDWQAPIAAALAALPAQFHLAEIANRHKLSR